MGVQKRLRRQRVQDGLEAPLRHDHTHPPLTVVKSHDPRIPEGSKVFEDHYLTPDGQKVDFNFNPVREE